MNFVVFDVETTGLSAKSTELSKPTDLDRQGSEIIQIGGLILDNDATPKSAFCYFCDCLHSHSESGAYKTHKIDLSEVRKEVPNIFIEDIILKWLPVFLKDDVVFIGYNVNFDLRMLQYGLRNLCFDFRYPKRIVARIPSTGRHYIDIMDFLPKRVKLSSLATSYSDEVADFFTRYSGRLPLQTNSRYLFERKWEHSHNALFDTVETYVIFKSLIWYKKVFRGSGV